VKIADIINRHSSESSNKQDTLQLEPYLKTEPNFLNEPAIISNSVGHYSTDEDGKTLVQAKTKKPKSNEKQDIKSSL